MIIFIKLIVILCLSFITEAGRILLVIPTPSISHQVVFRPLTQELARRGHDVVVITADPAFPKGQAPKNLTEIDVHDIGYKTWRDGAFAAATKGSSQDFIEQWDIIFDRIGEIFRKEMLTDQVQNLINDKTNHFDLVMVEACIRPAIGIAHVFKAPLILISSFLIYPHQYDLVGAPIRPVLLYPTMFTQRLNDLTLSEKLTELYYVYYLVKAIEKQKHVYDKIIRELFGPDTPSVTELEERVDMVMLNLHPIWDFNRPVPPNVVYMGGLHQNPQKDLPMDLKSYLDSSKHGVIYISYGTNVNPSQLSPEKIQVLAKTFSKLPYDVLWKWDKDELPGKSNNIRISKWLPQSDLLRHPNVKLFITQGGLQSTDEAITGGVPLIGMPMLADQWYNVEQYVYRKIGLRLDLETLTEENLKTAIETIINDKSYRNNMIKLRSIIQDQPHSPLERAVWWTEHVMRHGGAAHLRSRTANMSWAEYLDLELLTFLGVCALIIVILVCVAVSLAVSFARSFYSSKKLKRS